MKPVWQVERALQLSDSGWNNCQISRELGVNRRTVSDWVRARTRIRKPARSHRPPRVRGATPCPRCPHSTESIPGITAHAYAYLLGLYLGDGLISAHPRGVYRLRVFLDRAYPMIVAECSAAMGLVIPASKVGIFRHKQANMDEVYSFSKHWPHMFPQHGPGVKHKRRIALDSWQERIVSRHPGRLLRGLISLGRLSRHQQDPPSEEDLRISPLFLQQPLARHPAHLLWGA